MGSSLASPTVMPVQQAALVRPALEPTVCSLLPTTIPSFFSCSDAIAGQGTLGTDEYDDDDGSEGSEEDDEEEEGPATEAAAAAALKPERSGARRRGGQLGGWDAGAAACRHIVPCKAQLHGLVWCPAAVSLRPIAPNPCQTTKLISCAAHPQQAPRTASQPAAPAAAAPPPGGPSRAAWRALAAARMPSAAGDGSWRRRCCCRWTCRRSCTSS